jgi:hypothetical protein
MSSVWLPDGVGVSMVHGLLLPFWSCRGPGCWCLPYGSKDQRLTSLTLLWAAPRWSSSPYVLHGSCCFHSLSLFTVLFLCFGGQDVFAEKAPGLAVHKPVCHHPIYYSQVSAFQRSRYSRWHLSTWPYLVMMDLLTECLNFRHYGIQGFCILKYHPFYLLLTWP